MCQVTRGIHAGAREGPRADDTDLSRSVASEPQVGAGASGGSTVSNTGARRGVVARRSGGEDHV